MRAPQFWLFRIRLCSDFPLVSGVRTNRRQLRLARFPWFGGAEGAWGAGPAGGAWQARFCDAFAAQPIALCAWMAWP